MKKKDYLMTRFSLSSEEATRLSTELDNIDKINSGRDILATYDEYDQNISDEQAIEIAEMFEEMTIDNCGELEQQVLRAVLGQPNAHNSQMDNPKK